MVLQALKSVVIFFDNYSISVSEVRFEANQPGIEILLPKKMR